MRIASPLTLRILAVNIMAPVILVAGLFYLDRYKNELIAADLQSVRTRAEMVAAAIAEGAVIESPFDIPAMSPRLAREMVRRLAPSARTRTWLFDPNGALIADSRTLLSPNAVVQIEPLPQAETGWFIRMFRRAYNFIMASPIADAGLPPDIDAVHPTAGDYPELQRARMGEPGSEVRVTKNRALMLSVAVPVQHYKQVLGVVMAAAPGDDIARSLFTVRLAIFEVFAFALAITTLLSLYLAGTIARPIRLLAAAAERVRRGQGRHAIPDLTRRGDEIGDLSEALRDMTEALWRRMDAIEAFAADVAHEIKNPLTSLRSAVETAARVQNPEQQRKLMAIIQDDVARLDRLISDISDASRLDAELSRAENEPVEMRRIIETIADIYRETGAARSVRFAVEADPEDVLAVMGIESRLGQVLSNLVSNAVSFSPPEGLITLRGQRQNGHVAIEIEDEGPGIPENKLESIFERFYSERPSGEKFGTHSGLGLSISKQIVESHGGTIEAFNRRDGGGHIAGARFVLRLPAAPALAQSESRNIRGQGSVGALQSTR